MTKRLSKSWTIDCYKSFLKRKFKIELENGVLLVSFDGGQIKVSESCYDFDFFNSFAINRK